MSWVDPEKIPPALWAQLNISRERFAEIAVQMEEREKRAPAPGSAAPDFALRRLGPERKLSPERVRLADHRGRPVALVFGSYT